MDWLTDDESAWHEFWFVGDQHVGAKGCAMNQIKENVAVIRDSPRAKVALMGDCCDFITMSDKRYDHKQVDDKFVPLMDDLPKRVSDAFIELYSPIREKLVCLVPGNHEDTIRKRYHFDVGGYIAGQLGIPILDAVSQVRIRIRKGETRYRTFIVKGVLSHAHKGATTLGGKMAATERIFDYFGAHDFIAQAHMHEYSVHEGRGLDVVGRIGRPRIRERTRMMFLTGGYLKTYGPGTSYGESRGYRPSRLGSPKLEIRVRRTSYRDDGGRPRSDDHIELRGS